MVNKCVAYGCNTGANLRVTEDSESRENFASFHFPFKNTDLLDRWTKFVNRRDWSPKPTSVLCEKHFDEALITRGKRSTLKWELNPTPTKHSLLAQKQPSTLPTVSTPRKPPKIRNIEQDQLKSFVEKDRIEKLSDIDPIAHCPAGFCGSKRDTSLVFYMMDSDESGFPYVSSSIMIDENLHVKLQCNGRNLPLPKWFVCGHNATLNRFSMLENFPQYLKAAVEANPPTIIDELRKLEYYPGNARPPYSARVMRYALLQRYTSAAAYRVMLKQFPLPSFRLLSRMHSGGIDSLKTARLLHENGSISTDVILMADEMYLQAGSQYHAGEYVGSDPDGKLYKGIFCFMLVGLQESVPIIVRAVPECTVTGQFIISNFISVSA